MLKPHDTDANRLQQISSIATSEPIWSRLYFAHVGLLLFSSISAILLFEVPWLASFSTIYVVLFTLEKIVAARAYNHRESSRYALVLSLLTIRAVAYNALVIAIWSVDGDIFKMAALALLVAATINIMVFHNTYFPIIACVVGPIWLGFTAIASLFFVEFGPSPQSIAAALIVLCVSPYFYLALQSARERFTSALEARDEAMARFADLTGFSSEWYWEQDQNHRFTYLSEGFERATGVSPDKVLGKQRIEYGGTDPDALSESGDSDVAEAIEARKPFHNFIYKVVNAQNTEFWVRTSGKPVFANDGKFLGYRGVAADITKLYQAVREAKLASDAKSHFLTVVSHELRTPLTVMLGYNAFITKNDTLPSVAELCEAVANKEDQDLSAKLQIALRDIRTYSEKIKASGQQLQSIVSDLLDSTKMASGDFQLKLGCVGPSDDLKSTLEFHKGLAEQKGLKFEANIEDVALYADLTRIQQIISNLLSNAIKFTQKGSVSIAGKIREGVYCFEVNDTGIGMSEEVVNRAFEPFYQADATASRNHHGIGLGLSIVNRLVQLQGGKICLASTPGVGSKFTFTVPLYELGLGKPRANVPSEPIIV